MHAHEQEGLKLTPGQEELLMEVRERVMLWLKKAAVLRLEAYATIDAERVMMPEASGLLPP